MRAPLRAIGLCIGFEGSEQGTILEGVELDLVAASVTMVVGPNGCGKTTLLRTLAGLLDPLRGSVELHGKSLAHLPRAAIARELAYLPQDDERIEGLNVREVVALGRAPHQSAWMNMSAHDEEEVTRALALLRLTPLAHALVEKLSGGERRRVALARVLAQRPSVLILDEPAAALDVSHALDLYALLRRLAREDGLTTILSVHDLFIVDRFADRALVLGPGTIVADDAPASALSPATLSHAFSVEIEAHTLPDGVRVFVPRGKDG